MTSPYVDKISLYGSCLGRLCGHICNSYGHIGEHSGLGVSFHSRHTGCIRVEEEPWGVVLRLPPVRFPVGARGMPGSI